ncbi:MAG TPA: Ger(x)C family spore germination protein [Paenibacillaceae bacterium]|nr:Ger(x)C family spore germination protein [Paenibacillaceae bacterium]
MKKMLIFFSIVLLMLIVNTGCWSRKELNELSIVTGLGLDKIGDEYLLSAQVISPASIAGKGSGGKGGTSNVVNFESRGKTPFAAMRKMSTELARRLYFSHLRLLAFGDEFAKEGIGPVLDFFSRDHEFRSDYNIVIVHKDRAEDLLDILTPLETIPALKIHQSVEMSERVWGHTILTTIDDLIAEITSTGKEPVLSGLEIKTAKEKGGKNKQEEGEKVSELQTASPAVVLQHIHLAVFKRDKLMGWLTSKESLGTNFVLDKIKSTVIPIPCEQQKGKQKKKPTFISMEIMKSKTKNKAEIIDDEPTIHIEINTEASVGDVPCDIDMTKAQTIYQLENKLEKEIKKTVETAIHDVQKKFKLDIFGFGEVIHRKDPKLWKKLGKNWDKKFATLPVDVTVKVRILRTGTTNNSFLKK